MLLLFSIAITICYGETPFQVASKRYPVPYENEKFLFPYESSHDLFVRNDSIERVLFVIHSASYDAKQYYSNGLAMLDELPQEKDRTIIIAPHFLTGNHVRELSNPDFLYWQVTPFWGSSRGIFKSRGFLKNRNHRISAYEVIDTILTNLIETGYFPNLQEIVIMGHSAGGQMVNRYAACNLIEERIAKPNHINLKYVVMAPSSYVYFSKERPVNGSMTKFAIPENPDAHYNNWGYGLDNWYLYQQQNHMTADWVTQNYSHKTILYLVGSEDTAKEDDSLDKGPGAMLQGPNRLVRGQLYYNYLKHLYGDEIKKCQHFRIIQNTGHWGKGLMTSPDCVKFVFNSSSKENQ